MTNILNRDLRAIAEGLPGDHLEDWPHIPCPTCARGGLLPVHDSFVAEEAETSKTLEHHEGWDPDWIHGGFHGVLACSKKTCDRVRVIGEMNVGYTARRSDQPYEAHWTPTLFLPALPLLENRKLCPPEVGERVDAAAKILWLDPSAAANRVRTAVEALMDDRGVIRKKPNREGRVVALNLDARIATYKKALPQHTDAADLLLAVKWIGNVGSHEDVLRVPDVLEGVEFLDDALSLIYGAPSDDVRKRAAEVTARRGRPRGFAVEVPF